MEDGARVFDLHFTPAANDAPARIQIAIVGGACVVDGALLLADACASPEELDAQVDRLTAALAQLKSASRRRFAAAANADSPEWRERFAFMGLPEGARSWRGRLALHLVAQADAWHGLHQDAAQAPAEVLAGAQIAQIGEHTRLGRDFEALRPGQAQRQVQRLLAAVLADPDADCAPLRDGDQPLGRFARWHYVCDAVAGQQWIRRRRIDQPEASLALVCPLKAWPEQGAQRALEIARELPPLVETMSPEEMVRRLLAPGAT